MQCVHLSATASIRSIFNGDAIYTNELIGHEKRTRNKRQKKKLSIAHEERRPKLVGASGGVWGGWKSWEKN